MSAFPGTWAEYIEVEVVFARIGAAAGRSGTASPEHIDALRELAVALVDEQGLRVVDAALAVEAGFYKGQIAAGR
jgi:hypothetical protein